MENLTTYIHKFTVNALQECSYLVWDRTGEAVLIDPGMESEAEKQAVCDFIARNSLKPKAILLTHAHLDHIFGVNFLSGRYHIPVWMNPKEQTSIERVNPAFAGMVAALPEPFNYEKATDGTTVQFGESLIRALSTPGHSAGGLCWWIEKDNILFSGDSLFAGSIGRTDFEGGSLEELQDSLRNTLMQLDGEIEVYPGHGPATTIGRERMSNPFIYDDSDERQLLSDAFLDAYDE